MGLRPAEARGKNIVREEAIKSTIDSVQREKWLENQARAFSKTLLNSEKPIVKVKSKIFTTYQDEREPTKTCRSLRHNCLNVGFYSKLGKRMYIEFCETSSVSMKAGMLVHCTSVISSFHVY